MKIKAFIKLYHAVFKEFKMQVKVFIPVPFAANSKRKITFAWLGHKILLRVLNKFSGGESFKIVF